MNQETADKIIGKYKDSVFGSVIKPQEFVEYINSLVESKEFEPDLNRNYHRETQEEE